MNEEKPKCRYCGADMESDSYCWRCPVCHSNSPIVIWETICNDMTEEEKIQYAYERAMQHPPLRPMTLEEVERHISKDDYDPLWIEDIEEPSNVGYDACNAVAYWLEHEGLYVDYGVTWRCWTSKPSEDDMNRNPFKTK